MKKILRSKTTECRFLGSSPLHRKLRSARTISRGKDSFYSGKSFNYSLI